MLFENTEKYLMALCVFREARGAGREEKEWVAHVIRNRARAGGKNKWPQTVIGVILQPWQFSAFNKNDPNVTVFPDPAKRVDWEAWRECCEVVESLPEDDATGGSVYYHTLPVSEKWPKWALKNRLTRKIGAFHFYRG